MRQGSIWRGDGNHREDRWPTGWPGLDRLTGGGWPRDALVELLTDGGSGLRLLLPVIARLGEEGRWLAWLNPPHLPYAPALAAGGVTLQRSLLVQVESEQALWAAEQMLRSGACGAALVWPDKLSAAQVRRLQLAAETGRGLGVVFRRPGVAGQSSPAVLRLQVWPDAGGLRVKVLKRRGGWGGAEVHIEL